MDATQGAGPQAEIDEARALLNEVLQGAEANAH